MLRETTALDESFPADVAPMRSLTSVDTSVGGQVSLLRKRLSAILAGKWSIPSVRSLMDLQKKDTGKGTIANGADMWFFLSVRATVDLEITTLGKSPSAQITLVGFHSVVTSFVQFLRSDRSEPLGTVVTRERLFLRMYPYVSNQRRIGNERLVTIRATVILFGVQQFFSLWFGVQI